REHHQRPPRDKEGGVYPRSQIGDAPIPVLGMVFASTVSKPTPRKSTMILVRHDRVRRRARRAGNNPRHHQSRDARRRRAPPAAGLELVAEAPIDLMQSARRSIEEVNIGGLTLCRLTVHRLQDPNMVSLFKSVVELQRQVGVVRAFAPLPRTMNPAVPTTGYE